MIGKVYIGVFVVLASFALMQMVSRTLYGIWQSALYLYATKGTIPDPFRDADLAAAFSKAP